MLDCIDGLLAIRADRDDLDVGFRGETTDEELA